MRFCISITGTSLQITVQRKAMLTFGGQEKKNSDLSCLFEKNEQTLSAYLESLTSLEVDDSNFTCSTMEKRGNELESWGSKTIVNYNQTSEGTIGSG